VGIVWSVHKKKIITTKNWKEECIKKLLKSLREAENNNNNNKKLPDVKIRQLNYMYLQQFLAKNSFCEHVIH